MVFSSMGTAMLAPSPRNTQNDSSLLGSSLLLRRSTHAGTPEPGEQAGGRHMAAHTSMALQSQEVQEALISRSCTAPWLCLQCRGRGYRPWVGPVNTKASTWIRLKHLSHTMHVHRTCHTRAALQAWPARQQARGKQGASSRRRPPSQQQQGST